MTTDLFFTQYIGEGLLETTDVQCAADAQDISIAPRVNHDSHPKQQSNQVKRPLPEVSTEDMNKRRRDTQASSSTDSANAVQKDSKLTAAAAATAAETRAAIVATRGVGDITRVRAMQHASQAASQQQGDAPFGASRAWKLRETMSQSHTFSRASLLAPPATASIAQAGAARFPLPKLLNITPLANCDNTCFLNAIIQSLRAVCNTLGVAVPNDSTCPLAQLLAVSSSVRSEFRPRLMTHPLWRALTFGRQHDAHEALRLLLDDEHAMHENCTQQSCVACVLSNHCKVNFENHLTCTKPGCLWTSTPPAEPGCDVSIEINPGDLQTLLTDFEMPAFLTSHDDYVCQACGDLVQKTIRVQPIGRALFLHLKRFAFQRSGLKRHDRVTFPRRLLLGSARYEFTAMVEHIGESVRDGHYIAHVQSAASLLQCDDEKVEQVTWEQVSAHQSYLLAYVRTDV